MIRDYTAKTTALLYCILNQLKDCLKTTDAESYELESWSASVRRFDRMEIF